MRRVLSGLPSTSNRSSAEQNLPGNRLFYLATDPEFFAPIIDALSRAGLVAESNGGPLSARGWRRVIIEKPFGHDLDVAALNADILKRLRERQTAVVSTITWARRRCRTCWPSASAMRSSSRSINRQFVDHVQITAAETVGMEGRPARSTITPARCAT